MDCQGIIKDKVEENFELVTDFCKKNNYQEARRILIETWDLLPDDKIEYSESYLIVACILDMCLELNDVIMANKWIKYIYLCDKERIDCGEREMWDGKVAYASNNMGKAKELFKVAYEKSGGCCFLGSDEKYLKMLG